MDSGGHSTLFWFDVAKRKQVFFDPSGATGDERMKYFAQHHLWERPDTEPTLEVVDQQITQRLQGFIEHGVPGTPLPHPHLREQGIVGVGRG
jgi:hypothetical protein